MNRHSAIVLAFFALGACTRPEGTHPTDMSVAAHESAASQNERSGSEHAAQYDPNAQTQRTRCSPLGKNAAVLTEPCWSSELNPTASHLQEAGAFRSMAAEHRNAAQALRDAEASACAGIAADDRDISPFAHREDIASASDLTESTHTKVPVKTLRGATIVLRAVPGLTKEYLEREIACHLARNTSMGFSMSEMEFCPLGVKGATATVQPVEGGFAVEVKADDDAAAQEIAKRGRLLVSRPDYTTSVHR